jgi:hypothetical protein
MPLIAVLYCLLLPLVSASVPSWVATGFANQQPEPINTIFTANSSLHFTPKGNSTFSDVRGFVGLQFSHVPHPRCVAIGGQARHL